MTSVGTSESNTASSNNDIEIPMDTYGDNLENGDGYNPDDLNNEHKYNVERFKKANVYADKVLSSDDDSSDSESTGKSLEVTVEVENSASDEEKHENCESLDKNGVKCKKGIEIRENNNSKNDNGHVRRQRRSGVVNEYEHVLNSPTFLKEEQNENQKNKFFPEDTTSDAEENSNSNMIIQCDPESPSVYSGRKSILRNRDKIVLSNQSLTSLQDEDRKISTASSVGIEVDCTPRNIQSESEDDNSRKLSVASSTASKGFENNNHYDCEKLKKISYDNSGSESESEMGHDNKAYLSDSYLDNITKQLDSIIEKSKGQELQANGDCTPKKPEKRRKSSEVRFSNVPDIKIEYDAYEDKPYVYRGNNNGSTESFDIPSSSLADHVRKDSIALTKQNMGQIERIRKEFAMKLDKKPIWKRKSKVWKQYRLHIGVTVLFVVTMIFVSIGWHFHKKSNHEKTINQRIFFEARKRTIRLSDTVEMDHITGVLGKELPKWQIPAHCSGEPDIPEQTCLKWKGNAILRIKHFMMPDINCYNISWKSLRPDFYPHDCIDVDSAMWYGFFNLTKPVLPLHGVNFTFSASSSNMFDPNTFSSAIEYYWLSSDAGVIMVENCVPLTVKWNISSKAMCLIANYTGEFYGYRERPNIYLNYTICNGVDTLKTHKAIRGLAKQYPKNLPEKSMFQSPVWSTKAEAKTEEISDEHLASLLHRIKESQLNCSSIELDGHWEKHMGDLEFNSAKFPNISKFAQIAKNDGCGLSIIVSPYFSYLSKCFTEGLKKGYFLKAAGGNVPGFISLENTIAAMLDVSNANARSWFTGKLMDLASKYGIDSFHFHYGERSWIPYHPRYTSDDMSANTILKMFSEMMMSVSDEIILDGTAQSQYLSAFQRISTKIEVKDKGACLTGIIPSALTLGLLGYPFVLADGSFIMKQTDNKFTSPTRQLYIRWLQLTAFFPAVKYAVTPWSYDNDCLEVAKRSAQLHTKHIVPAIHSLSDKIPNGEPILRPVWWMDPSDKVLYTIDDQFMVGEDIMVAPILCEGQTSRSIYFPDGLWQDQSDQKFFQGKKWKVYNATLYDIPYFKYQFVQK